MKKFGCWFLTLNLLLGVGCMTAAASGETLFYASSFVAGTDDWFARGAGSVYRTTEGTLRTEKRTADWNSPGRNFELVPDNRYELSVEVLQNEVDSANFMISVEYSVGGAVAYGNIAHGTAKKGEWTTLKDTYVPGDADYYVLYVETTGAPQLSFDIRNFRVEAPDGVPAPRVTEAPMVIAAAENIPSLKEAYAGKFDFGCAIPFYAFYDQNLLQFVKEQFSILTPENELKPDSVLDVAQSKKLAADDPTAAAVHFDAATPLLNFAKENGLKVHGHVLVWHAQTPEEFFHEGYDKSKPLVTREVMLGRLENYIKGVMTWTHENYPGVIVSWDVVNEAIDDGTNGLRKSNWTTVIGEDFLARAFEYARKYVEEGTMLYYNDYNTAMAGKLAGIVRLLNTLIPEGNIDGYGFQMHHTSGSPSDREITKAVEKIASLGLKLRVSELDVGVPRNSEISFNAQAQKYAEVMTLMLRFAEQTEAVQVWGITDNMSWRKDKYPLLFDQNLNPKPAFWAVIDPESWLNQ